MTTMTDPVLLTDDQMQHFIAHGFLRLQTQLPESFHQRMFEQFDYFIGGEVSRDPGNNLLPAVPDLEQVFADPVVRGAITSVIGPDYAMHPHRVLHNNAPGSAAQAMHKDSYWGFTRRVRNHRLRWVMIMYVPQATAAERGPTGVIPGSQYLMQKPDEAIMPEVAGALAAGGFLLIHYDIWHRKMKNFTMDKRFMAKFEFIRMHAPTAPTWDHRDVSWRLVDLPGADLSAIWKRQWHWLLGRDISGSPTPAHGATAHLADPDVRIRLQAVNQIAGAGADAIRTALPALASLLRASNEQVAVDAAYAMAGCGQSAIPALRAAFANGDGEDTEGDNVGHGASVRDLSTIVRCAAHGLVEVGVPAVPALLDLLSTSAPRGRKHAAFALGEVASNELVVADALCSAANDAEPGVRINAVEALGLKTATPSIVAALSEAIHDSDAHVRFSAALSLAQIGPGAEAAVPALSEALHDDNRYVPGYAVEALERIASPQAMQTLIRFLKTCRWCPHTNSSSIF